MYIKSVVGYGEREWSGVWRHKEEGCMDSSALDCEVTRDAWHLMHYTWGMTSDALHLRHYIWCITLEALHLMHYTWGMTSDALHLIHDIWCITLEALHPMHFYSLVLFCSVLFTKVCAALTIEVLFGFILFCFRKGQGDIQLHCNILQHTATYCNIL